MVQGGGPKTKWNDGNSAGAGGDVPDLAVTKEPMEWRECLRALGEFTPTYGVATLLSLSFVFAFTSLFPQIYALYGTDGLTPFESQLSSFGGSPETLLKEGPAKAAIMWNTGSVIKHMPSFLWFSPYLGIPPDIMAAGLCVLGLVTSTLSALHGGCGSLLLVAWLSYLSIYQIDQVFLSFQWDILLLELGFLAVLYTPFHFSVSRVCHNIRRLGDSNIHLKYSSSASWEDLWSGYAKSGYVLPVQWLLRFSIVKLMIMSGAVKLQANCPTWNDLSAMDYHFATQCIPSPFAWYLAQLPPSVNALSTVIMFVIELPAPLLLLSPLAAPARIGVILQVLLQAIIIFSGNYNFFNILTIVVALACWRSAPKSLKGESVNARKFEDEGPVNKFLKLLHFADSNKYLTRFLYAISIGYLGLSSYIMFDLKPFGNHSLPLHWWQLYGWKFSWAKHFHINQYLDDYLPLLASFTVVMALASFMFYLTVVFGQSTRNRSQSVFSLVLRACLTLVLGGLYLGASTGHMYTLRQATLLRPAPQAVKKSLQGSFNWHISSGYGLFRRMTGVAHRPKDLRQPKEHIDAQWNRYLQKNNMPPDARLSASDPWTDIWGEPVAIVDRPEVVFSGSNDGEKWRELPFYYKPQALDQRPPWIVPHQPRLDWQMWFAALGSYQTSPWFVHLSLKILQGSPDVIRLMSRPYEQHEVFKWPFGWKNYSSSVDGVKLEMTLPQAPTSIKADKYSYDFTRVNSNLTPWNRRLPPTTCLGTENVPCLLSNETSRFTSSTGDQRWWSRSYKEEYLPRVTESVLLGAVSQMNWRKVTTADRVHANLQRITCNFPSWAKASREVFDSLLNSETTDKQGHATLRKTFESLRVLILHPLLNVLPPVDWTLGMGLDFSKQVQAWDWGTTLGSFSAKWNSILVTTIENIGSALLDRPLFSWQQSSINEVLIKLIEETSIIVGKSICQLQKFGQLLLYPDHVDISIQSNNSFSQATWLYKTPSFLEGTFHGIAFVALLPFLTGARVLNGVFAFLFPSRIMSALYISVALAAAAAFSTVLK